MHCSVGNNVVLKLLLHTKNVFPWESKWSFGTIFCSIITCDNFCTYNDHKLIATIVAFAIFCVVCKKSLQKVMLFFLRIMDSQLCLADSTLKPRQVYCSVYCIMYMYIVRELGTLLEKFWQISPSVDWSLHLKAWRKSFGQI